MNIKCVALGNSIMCDDGIGIKIVESIKDELEKINVKVVIGEVDVEYTFNEIEENDFLIIVDSTYFGISPGDVTCMKLEGIKELKRHNAFSHDQNLIDMLRKNSIDIKGYFLGIEISKICFDDNLSDELNNKFGIIRTGILENIFSIIKKEG